MLFFMAVDLALLVCSCLLENTANDEKSPGKCCWGPSHIIAESARTRNYCGKNAHYAYCRKQKNILLLRLHTPRCRTNVEALRESIANASAELFRAKDKDSAIVKKLKPPKTAKEKEKGKEANGDTEEQGEEEEEENKSGVGGLMIVKSAGEAWKRLQERLKDAPIIQVSV